MVATWGLSVRRMKSYQPVLGAQFCSTVFSIAPDTSPESPVTTGLGLLDHSGERLLPHHSENQASSQPEPWCDLAGEGSYSRSPDPQAWTAVRQKYKGLDAQWAPKQFNQT